MGVVVPIVDEGGEFTEKRYTEPTEDELVVSLLLHEDKKVYDRANFFVAAESFLFSAFVGLVSTDNGLAGWFKAFPIIICVAGIFIAAIWWYTSKLQLDGINRLRKKANEIGSLKNDSITLPGLMEIIYRWAPTGLSLIWASLLIFYVLQVTGWIVI